MASALRSFGSLDRTLFLILIGACALIVVAAWIVTVETSAGLMNLMGLQLAGAAPVDRTVFVSLAGVMMVAMMLPSAVPMLATYRALTARETGSAEGWTRTAMFSVPYFLAWTAFAALALVALTGLGVMGTLSGYWILLPGAILVAAGVYQFTLPKQFCLTRCQSTMGFLLTRWRPGRKGAFRMGADHVAICIGCCWLLMLVVFVSGAMSLLWMGAFTGIVLAEKSARGGPTISRLIGASCIIAGGIVLTLAIVPVSTFG
jgi:predicted metal-binding membrane protein